MASPSSPIVLSSDAVDVRRCSSALIGVERLDRRRRPGAAPSAALAARSPGMRIRLPFWSRARPIDWRIQNVAYVENLKPRRQSNLSTACSRPEVALLDEVAEVHALGEGVAAGDADHQPEVGADEAVLGPGAGADGTPQLGAALAVASRRSAAARPSSMTRASCLLLVRVEEGDLADLVEVHADGITHCERFQPRARPGYIPSRNIAVPNEPPLDPVYDPARHRRAGTTGRR